jgi:hypothetical protein
MLTLVTIKKRRILKEKEINQKAYELISKVKTKKEKENTTPLKGSIKHAPSVDLSEYIKPTRENYSTIYTSEIFLTVPKITIDNNEYYLENSDYLELDKLVFHLINLYSLENIFSQKTTLKETFKWIINIYIKKVSEINLTSHICLLAQEEMQSIDFFFPVHNLDIERPFKFGKVEFMYFTENFFNEYWESLNSDKNDLSKKDFDIYYRKYQGQVFIKSTIFAEKEKAEELASELSSYAIDALKLISFTVVDPHIPCLIDLQSRIPIKSEFLKNFNNGKFNLNINTSYNREPFYISFEMLKHFKNNFLLLGSTVGIKLKKDPLLNKIKTAISYMAKAISEKDLNIRVAQIITIIESLFLLENEDNKMQNKTKRRISTFLYHQDGKKREKLRVLLTNMYEIRHKIIHQSINLYIDPSELSFFQINVVESILKMISVSEEFNEHKKLIEYLDKK